jgi:hypothetical protein
LPPTAAAKAGAVGVGAAHLRESTESNSVLHDPENPPVKVVNVKYCTSKEQNPTIYSGKKIHRVGYRQRRKIKSNFYFYKLSDYNQPYCFENIYACLRISRSTGARM